MKFSPVLASVCRLSGRPSNTTIRRVAIHRPSIRLSRNRERLPCVVPVATFQPMTLGRPSIYTVELADEILRRLAAGHTLREICRSEGMPDESTVREWSRLRPEFSPRYAQAREDGYNVMAEEVLSIADDGTNDWMERQRKDGSVETVLNGEHVQRSRLRFDARRWLLSKALPKIYGDRLEHVGAGGGPLQVQVLKFSEDDDTPDGDPSTG